MLTGANLEEPELALNTAELRSDEAEQQGYSLLSVGFVRGTQEKGAQGYPGTRTVELLENHKPLQSEKLMNLLWEHFEGQVEPEEDDGTNQTQLVEDVELNLELAMEPLHNSVPLRME